MLMKTKGRDSSELGNGGSLVLPMPMLVKSTYDFMQKATMAAYDAINEEGGDPELVMGKGREDPKFGHHSWRRPHLQPFASKHCFQTRRHAK